MRNFNSLITLLTLALAPCCTNSTSPTQPAATSAAKAPLSTTGSDKTTAVLVGAGDVAKCSDLSGARATAKLIEGIPGTVFVVGDLAIPDGSAEGFANCYGPTWGQFKNRTRPVPGNHEYHAAGAAPYFGYFGAAAGDSKIGYYSYELAGWHIVALNSNCRDIPVGCGANSPEVQWLKQDLAQHPSACTLAYFHHPLFSSGKEHGYDPEMKPFWEALYDAKADVVINGHDHDYERFAPQDPNGKGDPTRGIREFVVGTGGNPSHHAFGDPAANSEVRGPDTYGVLKLFLHPKSYDWRFISVDGGRVTDSGSGACH